MKNIISLKLYFILLIILFSFFANAHEGFIENKGQFPNNVLAKKNISSGALFVEKGKLTFSFYDQLQLKNFHNRTTSLKKINFHAYSFSFQNINNSLLYEFSDKLNYIENYYLGEKSCWATNVNHFQVLTQKNIYDDIDLILYNHNDHLKYDLYIRKNANVNDIKIKYEGHEKIFLKDGNLIVSTSVNSVTELNPYAYQIINFDTVVIACNYALKKNQLSFEFPFGYNKDYDLVIDPILIFSTYSGSISDNFGYTATYDNFGYLYSGSTAFGVDYPTTVGAYQESFQGGITDVAITKYDSLGTSRIYSTYLGGSLDELPHSMVVNSNNELYILGTTGSDNFPTTQNSFEVNFQGGTNFFPTGLGVSFPNGSDIFISRLSSNGGALLSSTFVGGSDNDGLNTSTKLKFNYADEIRGEIDIDNNNNIYVVSSTFSNDLPVSTNAFQSSLKGSQDGCIIKMDNQLSNIIWASYIGGDKDDAAYSLEIDSEDNLYVTGGTVSDNFPVTPLAYNNLYNDSINPDAYISKIDKDGSVILSSTFYGSDKYDQSYFIEMNNSNHIYILGQTKADSILLVYNSNYYIENGGQFIAVFDNDLQNLLRSTMIGTGKGSPDISPTAFLVDKCNNIYISGWGSNLGGNLSTLNMPITNNAFQTTTDGNDFYLAVLNEFLDSLEYATYFGGSQSTEHVDGGTSRFDKNGVIYQSVCAGCGGNNDFPIYPNPGAVSTSNNSPNCNNAVFKFDFKRPIVSADFIAPTLNCTTTVDFLNTSSISQLSSVSYLWEFGDGINSIQANPTHQYQNPGTYDVKLIVSSNDACNFSDTIIKKIYVLNGSSDTLEDIRKCAYGLTQLGIPVLADSSISFSWLPNIFLTNTNISDPYTSADTNINYMLIISGSQCDDTLYQNVIVNELTVEAPDDTSYCNSSILLSATTTNSFNQLIWSNFNNFSDTISQQLDYLAISSGSYFIKISDSLCFDVDSVNVLSDLIDIDLYCDTILCENDTAFLFVENNIPANPIVNYNWISTEPIIYNLDSSNVAIVINNSSFHYVEVLNNVGCFIKDSIFINASPLPNIDSLWASDLEIILGASAELNVLTQDSILWFNQSNSNVVQIEPSTSSWYNINVYQGLCAISDSIYISVREPFCNRDSIVIPSAFTPNDDNVNDTYKIKNEGVDILEFYISIYNRLGQRVFSSNDVNFSWDGNFKGMLLQPQVFDYFLEITCSGGKKLFKKGNITLIK